ncbi:MAG TPA: hypothetical protein VFI16_11205 [Anaeromyxobacteraceae bacterium]|nr:hypothetical protein [Anaeromyxobacteraceae bacterium]
MIHSIVAAMLVSFAAGVSSGTGSANPFAGAARPLLVNLSLVPPLSVNSVFEYRTANALALDLLVGDSAALEGVELSGIGSRNGEVRGAQIAGLGNWVDAGAHGQAGDARGAQVAGLLNWTGGSLRGAQAAGALNSAGRDSSGAQVAGAVNLASALTGLQVAGALNLASAMSGVQVGGAVNLASAMSGVQVAGAVNVASEAPGVQVAGGMNFASGLAGVQVGVVNVARQADGAQLGVVNVAEDADVSLGVFSWVKHGTHDVGLAATEYGVLAEADTGGRTLYGILTGGTAYRSHPRLYLLGLGIGWRALSADAIALDVQAAAMQVVDADHWTERFLCSARAVVAMRVVGPLSVFAGPTFNFYVDSEPRKIELVGHGWKSGTGVRFWPGILAGLRLF